ncbi:ABC transporter permease [Kaistia dalseonensis]|uniref:Peptide/nickel transport system permease protein n=1 Tax=Kaistia dalseonensis TaxID=410840 RepID=A0ABU0H3B2_9HYPH|nr:ABC transporter permease [Kaistia dalseonensis]MCX5493721.1 ABC transporter permease [Kaistia dalseonensis]MDQ0436285.1 peptide/nickel transport system permease protein [Kaistia dalseonensis]
MSRFLANRLLRALITLFLTVTFVFIVLRFSGDPAEQMLSPDATPEAMQAFRERWGLDRSILEQYLFYVRNIASGEFGFSYANGRPVIDVVTERIPKTLILTGAGLVTLILIGVPAGIAAALRRNTAADRITMSLAVGGYSIPSFLLGLALIYVFAVELRWLPSSGSGDWRHAVLPIATYGLAGAAGIARFTRSAMIEVLDQPYIRAAKAAGIAPIEIVFRHALPNASIPIVTMLGFNVAGLLGGAVLVETVFAWPGLGSGFVRAVSQGDLAVVQFMVLIFTAFMVSVNFTVDVLYAVLNPRIRLSDHGAH